MSHVRSGSISAHSDADTAHGLVKLDMSFTGAGIAALRDSLNAYRIANTKDGKLPSWGEIACLVEESGRSLNDHDVKAEALRRFANGVPFLYTDMLEKIKVLIATNTA